VEEGGGRREEGATGHGGMGGEGFRLDPDWKGRVRL